MYKVWLAATVGLVVLAGVVGPAGAAPQPGSADTAILTAGVLSGGDVPPGWVSTSQPDTSSFADLHGVRSCKQIVAVDAAAFAHVPHALSPVFSDPRAPVVDVSQSTAVDEVYAFQDVKAASRYLAAFQARNATPCLKTAAEQSYAPAQVSVAPIAGLKGLGSANAGYEATVHLNQQGQALDIKLDLVAVRKGRIIVGMSFTNVGTQPLPQEPAIVTAVVGRLPNS
jgi:hypothetical protein